VGDALSHLFAVTFPKEAPSAKMLAIIGQQPIAVLSQSRASPPDGILTNIFWTSVLFDPDCVTRSKIYDGQFFHRAVTQ
jgi:hypothetical protein